MDLQHYTGLQEDGSNGTVRFGIGPFNTEEDIDHAIRAIKHIAEHARSNHVGTRSSGK
jgi:cysteine sulfinate desulfinase/cysteine desulfurase-like protein